MPIPDTFFRKSSFKVGIGIGSSAINLNFKTSEESEYGYTHIYTGEKCDSISISKNVLVFTVFGGYDFFFNRHWSIGLNIDYKSIPVKFEAFHLTGQYVVGRDEQFNKIYSSMIIDFPEQKLDFGGYEFGINLGFHF